MLAFRIASASLAAVVLLAGALPAQTRDAGSAFEEGLELYLEGNYADAAPHLLEATELDPRHSRALLYGALAHNNLGRYAVSDSLARMLATMEEDLDPYDRGWLGYLQHRLRGDNEGALLALEPSMRLRPETKAGYNYAWLSLGLNRPAAAKRALASVDPDAPPRSQWTSYWNLVVASHMVLGEYDDALRAANAAWRQFPGNDFVAVLVANPLAAMGRTDELMAHLESISDHETRGAWRAGAVMTSAALTLRGHGHWEQADRVLAMALDWFEGRPEAERATEAHRSWVAWTLLGAGRWDEARAAYEALSADVPDDLEYRALAGVAAGRAGDRAGALAVSRRIGDARGAYAFGENDFLRGLIAASLGDADGAVRSMEKAFGEGDLYFWTLRYHPAVEPIAASPGFRAMVRPKG